MNHINKLIWSDILYDRYIISSTGKVLNIKTNTLLKEGMSTSGYLCVKILGTTRYIHRLLGEAFLPNPYKYPQINHLDSNKLNNSLSNLEWCTGSTNINHYYMTKGKRGVTYHKNKKAYSANITIDNKTLYIGFFKNKEEAYNAFYNTYLNLKGVRPW
jgi:hypothetical protein